uniref:Uncharacterized protein n=1 Tax=Phlebotomus papatasi TaxID=29031 RepID=A0A1B0DDA8_PHLPP
MFALTSPNLNFTQEEATASPSSTLGMIWRSTTDQFHYKLSSNFASARTKREILACVASLYDPLGLIGPTVVCGKLILQTIWKNALVWDQPIPDDILREWLRYSRALPAIEQLTIPRWISTMSGSTVKELHIFTDASSYAYGAVAYAVSEDSHGHLQSQIDIPLHVAIITHLLIAWDRMRWLMDPLKARLPAFVCSCATWLAGMVIALPYPIYTTYLDLGDSILNTHMKARTLIKTQLDFYNLSIFLGVCGVCQHLAGWKRRENMYLKQFRGVGICAVNLVDDMQEYMRGLFVIMYCAPVTILSYLYIRTSRELREPDGPLDVLMFEARVDTRNIFVNSVRSIFIRGSIQRSII